MSIWKAFRPAILATAFTLACPVISAAALAHTTHESLPFLIANGMIGTLLGLNFMTRQWPSCLARWRDDIRRQIRDGELQLISDPQHLPPNWITRRVHRFIVEQEPQPKSTECKFCRTTKNLGLYVNAQNANSFIACKGCVLNLPWNTDDSFFTLSE